MAGFQTQYSAPAAIGRAAGSGPGAWEVGVRCGRLITVTLGVTWYWNPNVRAQVNYDYAYRDGGTNPLTKGSIHSLGTRLALDF